MSEFTSGWITDQHLWKLYVADVLVEAMGEGLTGTDTIASGGTSVTCTHSLGAIPKVFLTALSNLGTKAVWISDKTETSFVINISDAAGEDYSFDWRVHP
jgi:hypothetical protein